jgi:hypothetical protein
LAQRLEWQRDRVRGVVMAKVYVSSTIIDLERERVAVLDWLRLARHQAIDSYLPDSDTVRASCLEDVGSCDLYVLIVGHRYGFQPPEDNPEGLSITHLEFRRAGECGIPQIVLLRTSIPDVRASDVEDPDRAPLVLAFRAEVARAVRPAEFSDLQGAPGSRASWPSWPSGTSGRLVRWRRGGCCGWRRGRCSWPGEKSYWPRWRPGWPEMTRPGRGWWR